MRSRMPAQPWAVCLAWLLVCVAAISQAEKPLQQPDSSVVSAHRKDLSHNRGLVQSCSSCPSDAAATCSALTTAGREGELNTLRAKLISSCGLQGFDPATCCPLQKSSDWDLLSACACSDVIPGLSAFVSGPRIMSECGCGEWQTTSDTRSSLGQATIGRSEIPGISMQAIYDAVTFGGGNASTQPTTTSSTTSSSSTTTSDTSTTASEPTTG